MAALLTGDIPGRNFVGKDALVEHMEDCDRMGIDVVFPSVNTSDVHFKVDENNDVHFAMSAIKGCGASAAQAIVDERTANGPFTDIFDFCERVESGNCSRSAVESLIKAGALDCFGGHRAQLTAALDRAIQAGASAQADKKSGQLNLFGAPEPTADEPEAVDMPDVPEWQERETLVFEKEVLGFYLTSHPLAEYADRLTQFCSHKTSELEGSKHRDKVSMGGMIAALRLAHTKNQKSPSDPTKYAMFDLEDVDGAIRTIAWPSTFASISEHVKADAIVVVQGKLDYRGDEPNLIVDKLVPIDDLGSTMTTGIKVMIDQHMHGHDGLKTAYEIIRGYPGNRQLKIELVLEDGMRVQLDSNRKIEVNEQLCGRLRELLGTSGVEMLVDTKSLSAKAGPEKGWRKKRD